MDQYTATEMAYKHGYEKGYAVGKPKWIPVGERLPHMYQSVLVCDVRDNFVGTCSLYSDVWVNGNTTYKLEGMTHWMPLPEPPKEDE